MPCRFESEARDPDGKDDPLNIRKKDKNLYDVFGNEDLAFIKWDMKNKKWMCMARITPGYVDFCDSPSSFDNVVNRYIR